MLYRFLKIIGYFPKFKEVTLLRTHPFHGQSIMHPPILINIYQHTECEVPGFTDYKDMTTAPRFNKLKVI